MLEHDVNAYLVGGCVRDILRGVSPKDWDITTDATPERIQEIFDNTFYENNFGTVGVVVDSEDPTLKVVEVTPHRTEARYTDKRHPDVVNFTKNLEEDLKRRDFTVNAMALTISPVAFSFQKGVRDDVKENEEVDSEFVKIIDLWGGQADLKNKILKSVGEASDRFEEDALRMLRAVRLSAEMGFKIEKNTELAIKEKANLIKIVSKERIRDEFSKIIMSEDPYVYVVDLKNFGLLQFIIPELEEGEGVGQNKEHVYEVWEHNLRALKHAAEKGYSLEVRLAALLHDVGKPRVKKGNGPEATFYNHEVVGARMTAQILSKLRYPKKFIEKVALLVRWHLFFSDTEVITLSAVRRIVRNVGKESIWDLMKVRFCDRIGMGRPKEEPYRLRKYESMIEEVLRDPLSVSSLKIDGKKIMEIAKIEPSPKVGDILHALLEEVLEDPTLNTEKYLSERTLELVKLSSDEIQQLGESGKNKKEEEEAKKVGEIRKKYGVK
ncbi:MAG: CCA tRNA nucleotidyltransferase [Candidatus Marinimicrobia bacterium]|nr:CCA tRNA nucleotidyltransferase [Candidatus Neomarinimicrobiota bacterium]